MFPPLFGGLRAALALAAFLQLAHSMRVDPERIWARLKIEAEAQESAEMAAGGGRNRRQLVGGSPKEETIQVTAPLFSSRLFEFGPRAGDKELSSGLDSAKKLPLSRPLFFYGQQHSAIWVFSNGAIGFEQNGRQYRANILPSGVKLIAPFWNRNDLRNGGKIYYREVASGRVLERGQSEIRYQYELDVKVHSAVLATFEKMQPVGTDPLPDENTNTFQVALFITSNGTFANFIYSNIGWTQGAEAGFNAGDGVNFFALPTSGTGNIMYLEDYGNTGIPGEWMFVLGAERVQRCKAGIKGDTCDEACAAGEWGPDCVRCCHCAEEKGGCNEASGECKQGGCAQCWTGQNCQQRDKGAQCSNGQRQCGQNAMPMTEMNRCGEPQHRCECLAGYQGDPYKECNDIDECARPNTCHQKAQCTNTPGRFFCQCQDGFQGDGISECVASFLYPFEQSHRLPNDRHGRVEWQLKHPLRIFGRVRESLWLTSNGLILVKGAKNVPMKSGEKHALDGMDVQGVAPFFAPMDLGQQGQIYVEETTDPRILAKADQLVNEQLGAGENQPQQQFVANHALLVTYVNVSLASASGGHQKPMNTFQTILIGGRDRLKRGEAPMTFVEFLYRDIQWGEDAEAGIMAPDKANSILLPGSGTEGIEQLSQLSNVRSQGVWLYRIDGAAPSACIQSDLQPPYCDARSPAQSNRPPPPPPSTIPTLPPTTPAPTSPSSTPISPSFGVENEEDGGEEQQIGQQIRPQFPRVEQNGWVPVGGQKGGQKQPAGKKPAIVQIHSREFEEMPPDAFDDGTVSRGTTKATEEEEEGGGGDESQIREIIPSLIVPELVKPSPQPPLAPTTRVVEAKIPLESTTHPQRPQIQIEQQPIPSTPSPNSPIPSQTTIQPSTTMAVEEMNLEEEKEGNEPMQTIRPGEEREEEEGGQMAPSSTVATTILEAITQQSPSIIEQAASNRPPSFFVFNTTKSKAIFTTKKVFLEKASSTTEVPKMKPENADGDDPILMDWEQQGNNNPLLDGASGPPGNKLSIVVPIAIVLVWLVVLVIVAVFLCCRRRQTQERLRTLYGPAYQIRPVYTMRNFKGANGFGGSGEPSYEEHLEKAAQRLSAELAYNPNPLWAGPGRYSLYGSYWNISPEGSAAGRINGGSGGHSKQRPSAANAIPGAGGQMDICSPRSQENGGGAQNGGGGGTSVFGNYVQQLARNGANGNGEREAAHSEYFGTGQRNSSTALGPRFSGRH